MAIEDNERIPLAEWGVELNAENETLIPLAEQTIAQELLQAADNAQLLEDVLGNLKLSNSWADIAYYSIMAESDARSFKKLTFVSTYFNESFKDHVFWQRLFALCNVPVLLPKVDFFLYPVLFDAFVALQVHLMPDEILFDQLRKNRNRTVRRNKKIIEAASEIVTAILQRPEIKNNADLRNSLQSFLLYIRLNFAVLYETKELIEGCTNLEINRNYSVEDLKNALIAIREYFIEHNYIIDDLNELITAIYADIDSEKIERPLPYPVININFLQFVQTLEIDFVEISAIVAHVIDLGLEADWAANLNDANDTEAVSHFLSTSKHNYKMPVDRQSKYAISKRAHYRDASARTHYDIVSDEIVLVETSGDLCRPNIIKKPFFFIDTLIMLAIFSSMFVKINDLSASDSDDGFGKYTLLATSVFSIAFIDCMFSGVSGKNFALLRFPVELLIGLCCEPNNRQANLDEETPLIQGDGTSYQELTATLGGTDDEFVVDDDSESVIDDHLLYHSSDEEADIENQENNSQHGKPGRL